MKRLFKPIVRFFCVSLIMSCAKKDIVIPLPEVQPINSISDYTITRDPNDYFTFNFKSQALKYTKLEWRFGDDSVSTDLSPTHTFLNAGDPSKKFIYTVDLKTTSSTGNISHKYADLAINPDSVVQITTAKTSTSNQLQFGTVLKAPLASTVWTFADQAPYNSVGATTIATQPSPLKTYAANSVNTVTVKVTTPKGSSASITKIATTAGLIQDITQSRTSFIPSTENLVNTEVSKNLVDGNSTSTKFTMGTSPFTYPVTFILTFANPVAVKEYAVGNCGDNVNRDPKAWTVEGSNDGITWTILDTQVMTKNFYDQGTALGATSDAQRWWKLFYFPIANPKPFSQYRWKITANWGDAKIQISEFQLFR